MAQSTGALNIAHTEPKQRDEDAHDYSENNAKQPGAITPLAKKGLNKASTSKENFFGVPPDMTESSHKVEHAADFDDEEEEADAHNNFLTQAELFRSYSE
jgi:hypothetical protein